MRKSLIAMAALMGVGVLPTQAVTIRVSEETFGNMGVRLQIWGQRLGKTTPGGRDYTDFSIANAKIYFDGQVNKLVQFGAEMDFTTRGGTSGGRGTHQDTHFTRVVDARINLKLMDEFQVMAGLHRVPFNRATLTSSYSFVVPTGYSYAIPRKVEDPVSPDKYLYSTPSNYFTPSTLSGSRDAGITLWGNVADGMFQYRLGVYDGKYDHTNSGNLGKKDYLAYSVRVQFTPTMLGYKGEKSYALADTYLGKQDVLTIGLGYNAQKWDDGQGFSGTAKAWAVDAMWEQKFGDIVPNLQLGYTELKDIPNSILGASDASSNAPKEKFKYKAYYVQGQLLYDQVVGVGKPAIAFRYEKLDDRDGDLDANRLGVFVNYYIKGQDAKIQFGADIVNLKNTDVDNKKDYTDWTLALQIQF